MRVIVYAMMEEKARQAQFVVVVIGPVCFCGALSRHKLMSARCYLICFPKAENLLMSAQFPLPFFDGDSGSSTKRAQDVAA